MRIVSALALAALLAALPAGARAADAATDEARMHFRAGLQAYQEGRYREALEELRQAMASKPHPLFLYNIGLTYAKMRDFERAIESFERYLELDPSSPTADNARTALEEARRARRAADLEPPTATPTGRRQERLGHDTENPLTDSRIDRRAAERRGETRPARTGPRPPWYYITGVVAGVALVGLGAGMMGYWQSQTNSLASAASSDASSRLSYDDVRDLDNSRQTNRIIGIVGLTVGSLLGAGCSIGLGIHYGLRRERRLAVAPYGGDGVGVAVAGGF